MQVILLRRPGTHKAKRARRDGRPEVTPPRIAFPSLVLPRSQPRFPFLSFALAGACPARSDRGAAGLFFCLGLG